MDATQLHAEVKNLLIDRQIDEHQLLAAEKVAFLTMAHYLDLDAAQVNGSFATTSGTEKYDITSATMDPVGSTVDRITSAVWNGTSNKPLNEIHIRKWMHSYYGLSSSSRTGTPEAICIHQGRFYLLKAPNETGTVYFTAQRVLNSIVDFPDSHLPLMIELIKFHLARTMKTDNPGVAAIEARLAWNNAKQLIKSFKDRLWVKKDVVEMSSHRARRMEGLNELV